MKNNPTIKSILQAIKRMPLLTIVLVIVVIGAIVSALLPPLILERVVNLLTAGKEADLILVIGYFGMLALSGVLESAREALLTVFGQKITHHLRSTLCDKFTRLPADAFVRTEPGVTASRFVNDVDTVEELFTSGIISMFADACQMVSIFVILFRKNTGLAILMLVILPLIYLFTRMIQKRTLKAQKENRVAIGRASNYVPETIRSIRTIHTMKAETYMEDQYDKTLEDSFAAVEKTNFYDSVYSPTILILNAVITAFVMILAATGNIRIQTFFGMSVGTAVAVIAYISQVFSPIESIGMEIQTIQSAAAGVHRINEFLVQAEREIPFAGNEMGEREIPAVGNKMAESDSQNGDKTTTECAAYEAGNDTPECAAYEAGNDTPECAAYEAGNDTPECAAYEAGNDTPESAVREMGNDKLGCATHETGNDIPESGRGMCVVLHHVTFSYDGSKTVLKDVNLTVRKGEQVTITGRTGAGKSTIFKLLLGLYRPESGTVKINGRDVASIPDNEKRHLFGYVEQTFYRVPGTVRDQITLFDIDLTDEDVITAAKTAGLHEAILNLEHGYDTPCEDGIFSQGQWQLLSIARAIAAKPEILLLDEITANLDADTEQMVLTALKNAAADRTVLSISHRLYENMGGREFILEDESQVTSKTRKSKNLRVASDLDYE